MKSLLLMGLGALPLVAFALYFNYARFGSPFDSGYTHISASESPMTTLFNLRYIPRNLYVLFFRGPNMDALLDRQSVSGAVQFAHGVLGSDMGTGLLYSSPFLLFGLLAPIRKLVALGSSVSFVLNLIPICCYTAIGMLQINSPRYSLDFLPELFLLTILGLKTIHFKNRALKPLLGYSVALNAIFLTPVLAWILQLYFWILTVIGI